MILETERLLLTDYKLENLDVFFKLKSCNEVWKYSTFDPLKDKDQARILLENLIDEGIDENYIYKALYKKDSMEFIGEAGIIGYITHANRCVIGYNLLPQYWNHGYATEITKNLVKYSFEFLGVERIEALALQINTASCRVLEKSGFLLEGVLRNFNKCETGYRNVCYYGMISSDFDKR
ncbi:GNAT family N-acetyltransferase [Sedimentibacter saalensis]|uniref:Ribosomal-protein-alanine N-acetyltransferase n=1 Tax=Sedimentibacter saalensis TaxID=130788 RepID=A0A562JEZ1_9FIRM|nr:GNAT family protein [Sedimentibacter saalensis]TWH81741.1 ribosomal-protein-alanine N-acetyltransferase [Sedimentibacter saalensis]